MAYLRMGGTDSCLGSFGCGSECSCASCRAQNSPLAEWYVPDDDDDEPARPAPPQPTAKSAPAQPGQPAVGGFSGWGLGAPATSKRVVFVPGIMGSRLVDRSDKKIVWGDASMLSWIPQLSQWVKRMRQGNGIDSPGNIQPAGLFRIHSPVHPQDLDPYSGVITRLQRTFGAPNVRACSYDWRLSNEHSAQRLKRLVESTWPDAATHPSQRITILAHSMGGLVARWYIEKLGGHRYVKRLVTVGTPHHGAPKAIQFVIDVGSAATAASLLSFLGPVSAVGPLASVAAPLLRALQKMVTGFASIYQLMPDFDCVYPTPVATAMEPIAITYRKLASSPVLNPILGAPASGRSLIRGPRAKELRRLNSQLKRDEATLDRFLSANHVDYIAVAGFTHDTVMAVRNISPINVVALVSRCGDGTVPVSSAALRASPLVRTLYTATAREHGVLFWDPAVQQLCLNAVMGLSDSAAGIRPTFVPSHGVCAPSRPAIPFVGTGPNFVPPARAVQTVREFVR